MSSANADTRGCEVNRRCWGKALQEGTAAGEAEAAGGRLFGPLVAGAMLLGEMIFH
jgi:hypothetical protein